MRTLIAILLSLLVAAPLSAIQIDYRISGHIGCIMPDGKVDRTTSPNDQPTGQWTGPVWGTDISLLLRPNWTALQQWRGAGIGIGLSYWNFSHEKLGHAIAPYICMDIPLVQTRHFNLGLRPGIGAAFATKTYRNTLPKEDLYTTLTASNCCIGSMLNLYFPEALYMEFPISQGWAIGWSGGWYHISNGSVRQPNSGYNIFATELGIRYTPRSHGYHPRTTTTRQSRQHPQKNWQLAISATASGRQVYYKDQQTFFVASMHAAAYWLAHPIFRLGGGIDAFYDGAYIQRYTEFEKTNHSAAQPGDCWRVGVSIQPEFVVGKFSTGIHIGAYLFDPVKELEPYSKAIQSPTGRISKPIFYPYDLLKAGSAGYPDGWLYTMVVLRYHLPWHTFVQAMMKSHLTKVEFVSLGIGFYY